MRPPRRSRPAGESLLLLAKRSHQEKATRASTQTRPVRAARELPCAARSVGRLRNSLRCASLRQCSPTAPDSSALLGGSHGEGRCAPRGWTIVVFLLERCPETRMDRRSGGWPACQAHRVALLECAALRAPVHARSGDARLTAARAGNGENPPCANACNLVSRPRQTESATRPADP